MEGIIALPLITALLVTVPMYFGHMIYSNRRTIGELRKLVRWNKTLNRVSAAGASLVVVSAVAVLMSKDGNGLRADLWIFGSLAFYLALQAVSVRVAGPVSKQLGQWLQEIKLDDRMRLPEPQSALIAKVDHMYYVAAIIGTLLFVLMILKPL